MKRIVAGTLSAIMLLSLSACGGGKAGEQPEANTPALAPAPTESTAPTPEPTPEPLTVENASIELEFNGFSGTITYTGAVDENALPHGQGTGDMESDSNGDSWVYTGTWEHGHFCGQGGLTSHSGNYVQNGEFKNDMLCGYGSQTQDGVLRYEGQWLDGDMHGQGVLYTKAGDLLYGGMLDHNLLAETQAVRDVRVAPFKEQCEAMDTAFYASWKDGCDVLSCPLSVRGSIAAMSGQGTTGTVLICMNDDPNYIVALTYRYSVDEPKISAEDGYISAWGFSVGTFEYFIDGAPTFCPQIEVVYWTTE